VGEVTEGDGGEGGGGSCRNPHLLTEPHFVEKPALPPLHHSMEPKSVDCIQDPFLLLSCKSFHFSYIRASR